MPEHLSQKNQKSKDKSMLKKFTLIILILSGGCSQTAIKRDKTELFITQNDQLEYVYSKIERFPTKKTLIESLSSESLNLSSTSTSLPSKLLMKVYFPFDNDQLQQSEVNKLKQILPHIKDKKITLIGHTDNIGPKDYNKKLSSRRAQTISHFLVKNHFAPDLIHVQGRPLCCYVNNNQTREQRRLNRRVEIHIN